MLGLAQPDGLSGTTANLHGQGFPALHALPIHHSELSFSNVSLAERVRLGRRWWSSRAAGTRPSARVNRFLGGGRRKPDEEGEPGMKRLITTALTAAASVAVLSTPALAASHSTRHTFGSCRAQGDFAICDASGTANHPATIRVHVSASPSQKVLVSWDITCSEGLGAGGRSGQFTAHTTVNRLLKHPYKHPAWCIVAAGAQLSGSGALHVWLTYTR